MYQAIMPKATALWLIKHTSLTFEQIATFCGLHPLEIRAIADGDVAYGMVAFNPILNGQLTQEEIDSCTQDPERQLQAAVSSTILKLPKRKKGARYIPLQKRGDKRDAIDFLLKHYPKFSDSHIIKLLGTNKTTIESIRNRTHIYMATIKPRDPVFLGLCTQEDLDNLLAEIKHKEAHQKNKKTTTKEDPSH